MHIISAIKISADTVCAFAPFFMSDRVKYFEKDGGGPSRVTGNKFKQAQLCNKLRLRRHLLHKCRARPRQLALGPARLPIILFST